LERFTSTCRLKNNYTLIADRYVDIFPFNELADTNLIKYIKEGNLTEQNIEDNISSINIPNSNTGMTPLIYAIINKTEDNIDSIELIINKGADINYYNIYNHRSVLLYTIEYNKFDITDLLYSLGANINNTGNGEYMSQLMIAIVFNSFTDEQVDKLFDLKPDNINYIYDGKTGLELAIYYSKLSFIGPLVNAGADTKSGTENSLVFEILGVLIEKINDLNAVLIENTIKILIQNVNIDDILKSSFYLLIRNQYINIDEFYENKSKIITILFKLIEATIIQMNYCDNSINIFHLYKLNTIYKLSIDTIKTIYDNCQIRNKDLTDIIVDNYDNWINFINWIDEHELYVNKIDIYKNNTEIELIPPKVITEFIVHKPKPQPIFSFVRSLSTGSNDNVMEKMEVEKVIPTKKRSPLDKPLLFLDFVDFVDDSIVI
jgi:ankyrin repeat protein